MSHLLKSVFQNYPQWIKVHRSNLFYPVCLTLVLFMGCSSSRENLSSHSNQAIDKDKKLAEHIIFDIVDPKMKSFASHVKHLSSQVKKACDGIAVSFTELRSLWLGAMMDFHYLEVLAFGPLSAGEGVVKRGIYSLPVKGQNNLIDREIQKAFRRGSNYRQNRVRNYLVGLDAIEYVLFEYLKEIDIEIDVIKNNDPVCNYLVFITEKLHYQVKNLTENWQLEEVDFIQSPEGQTRMGEFVKRITDSLIVFADKGIKDQKVRDPMGKGKSCPEKNCAELYLEHPFSEMAKEALIENLKALSDALSGKILSDGKRGFGYDSYLSHLGVSEKNRLMIVQTRFLLSEWKKLPDGEDYFNLFSEINKSSQPLPENNIVRLYDELKKITDWLKKDFVADLNTELPGSVQGDND